MAAARDWTDTDPDPELHIGHWDMRTDCGAACIVGRMRTKAAQTDSTVSEDIAGWKSTQADMPVAWTGGWTGGVMVAERTPSHSAIW
jgi:hypothetical protein